MMKALLTMTTAVFLFGCGGEQIQTYKAPKEPSSVQNMPAPVQTEQVQPKGKGFTADLPDGWTENPGSGMRIVSYSIEGTAVDFYLISLSMGDVPSNVNRWRGQVGLPAASPEEIAADGISMDIGGHPAHYAEIYNLESGKGIIAAIIDLSPQYWYFTAKGTVEELQAHAADIRAFLESIAFEGHSH